MKTRQHWSHKLVKLGVCGEAIRFARTHSTCLRAWKACRRGDWLLWYLSATLPDTQTHIRKLTKIAIRIVRTTPNRQPIPVWETWADNYLRGKDYTRKSAAEAAEAA